MRRRPTAFAPWAFVFFVACACDDHEPEVERQGPPIPDADVNVPPPNCGTGGEGGAPSVLIEFCQAEIILRTVCQKCHTDPQLNGAPFSLITYEDTQQPFGPDKLRWQRMQEVVEADIMPFIIPGVNESPLTCEEKATLMGWLNQCAEPVGGTECDGSAELLTTDEAGCDGQ